MSSIVADVYSRYNFPPPYSAGSAAAPGSAAYVGIGGAWTPGAAQHPYSNEDAANKASDEGKGDEGEGDEEEGDEGEGGESGPEDEGTGNKAGFAISQGYPHGECLAMFRTQ